MLDPGDSGCTHGLSKRIHDAMLANPCGAIDGPNLKNFAFAISSAVVAEIQANAQVVLNGTGSTAVAYHTTESMGFVPTPNTSGTALDAPISGSHVIPVTVPLQGLAPII